MYLFSLAAFFCIIVTSHGRLGEKFSDTAEIDEISSEDDLGKRVTLWECYDDVLVYQDNRCRCGTQRDDYYSDIKYVDCCGRYDEGDHDYDWLGASGECNTNYWQINYLYDMPISRKWMIYDVEDGTSIAYGLKHVDYDCDLSFSHQPYDGTFSKVNHQYEYVPIGIGKSTVQYKRGASGWDFSFKTSETDLFSGSSATYGENSSATYGEVSSARHPAKIYRIYAHNKNSALVQECDYDSSTQPCSEIIQCDYRVVKSKPDPSTFAQYGIALNNETTVAANTAADA